MPPERATTTRFRRGLWWSVGLLVAGFVLVGAGLFLSELGIGKDWDDEERVRRDWIRYRSTMASECLPMDEKLVVVIDTIPTEPPTLNDFFKYRDAIAMAVISRATAAIEVGLQLRSVSELHQEYCNAVVHEEI